MNLRTASDEEQLAFVRAEGRVLVTHETDFSRIASQTHDHPGIAYAHKDTAEIGEMIRAIILIYEVLEPQEMIGQVEFL
jgi:predicted nuclease of predicted toxin-antitoxin system